VVDRDNVHENPKLMSNLCFRRKW